MSVIFAAMKAIVETFSGAIIFGQNGLFESVKKKIENKRLVIGFGAIGTKCRGGAGQVLGIVFRHDNALANSHTIACYSAPDTKTV